MVGLTAMLICSKKHTLLEDWRGAMLLGDDFSFLTHSHPKSYTFTNLPQYLREHESFACDQGAGRPTLLIPAGEDMILEAITLSINLSRNIFSTLIFI